MTTKRVLVLIALLSVSGCDQFRGPEQQLGRAEAAMNAGEYGTASVTLRTLVQKDPANSRAQLLLARAEWLQSEPESAVATLDAATKAGADAAEVAGLRAQVALDQGKYRDLIVSLESTQLPLSVPQRQRFKARALLGMQRPVEALAIIDELLGTEPATVDLLVLAAQGNAMLGRNSLAGQYLDRALEVDPKSSRAWLLRAALQVEDSQQARASLQQAIASAPGRLTTGEQATALASAASAALSAGDVNAASGAHAGLIRVASQAPLTAVLGAQIDVLRGKNAEAVASLQRLAQQYPDLRAAHAALIGALLASGSYELALHEVSSAFGSATDHALIDALRDTIKKAAAAQPGSEEQTGQAAAAAASLQQVPAALQILRRGLSAQPDSLRLALAEQQLTLRSGRTKEALQMAQALAKRTPEELGAVAALAEALSASGENAAALASYESLWARQPSGPLALVLAQTRVRSKSGDPLLPLSQWLGEHPQDFGVRMGRAIIAQQLGQGELATADYERVIAQQPRNVVALNNLATLYQQRKDVRALSVAKRAYEVAPTLPAVADTYGWLLADSGDANGAAPILRAAVQGALAQPDLRYHLAIALTRSGAEPDRLEARALLADLLRDERPFPWRVQAQQLLSSLPVDGP